MIWLTSTNFFANQFTQVAGYFIEWPEPLKLEEVASKDLNPKLAKASSTTNAYQLKSNHSTTLTYTQGLISREVSNQPSTHAIVILGGGRQRGTLDLPDYQCQNLRPSIDGAP